MMESRKRARDEDDFDWQPEVRDQKKLRALPFRASPTTKHINTFSLSPRALPKPPLTPLTPALTPSETSEDESEPKNPFKSPIRAKSAQLTMDSTIIIDQPMDLDTDMDCSPSIESPSVYRSVESSQPSPCTIAPRTLFYNPQEVNNGGRIPTPIYGHFSQADRSMEMDVSGSRTPTQQEIAHDQFMRRRRLPTPISEDEDMDAPDGMGRMLGRLDMGPNLNSPSNVPFKTNKMWGAGEAAATTIPPIPKGKVTISMGYRADCEKCRMKVPGHYNHFIRA
ncbi:MAG: hypothetical protein Q9220_001130 [cf. Caloplaca sp. 1 TL-2023]